MSKKSKDKVKDRKAGREKLNVRGTGPMQQKKGVQSDRPRSAIRTAKPVTFDSAMTLSAVWACMKILIESVATLPLQMYTFDKNGDRVEVKDHDLIRLLRNKPNRYQTSVEFKETLMLNLLSGNAYIKKDYIGKKLVSLQVINSGSTEPVLDDQGNVTFESQLDKGKTIFQENEIWHIKLFGTGLVGMSPLAYGSASIGVGLAANDKTTRLMSNGAKPTGALKTDKFLKKEQRQQLRDELDVLVNGDDGDMPVLEGGMTFEQISLTPADIQLVETRRLTVEDACRYFGVPPILVYLMDGSTSWGSGIDSIIDGFYKFGLRPYLERIEESIRIHLLPREDWDDYEFEFKTKELLRASYLARITANKERILSGQNSMNEIRREEGDPPKLGADFLLAPVNMVTAERMQKGNYGAKADEE